MIGLMFSASVVPSKSLSTTSSIETNSMSGFAMAASPAAEASAKPTVMMSVQFWSTRLVMFGAKSASESDWTATYSTPSSSDAASRPSNPSWLNDLSSNPPASETMHGLKPSTAPPAAADSLVAGSGADPQPARATSSPAAATTPTNFLVVEIVNSRLHKRCPADFAGDGAKLPTVTPRLHTGTAAGGQWLQRRNTGIPDAAPRATAVHRAVRQRTSPRPVSLSASTTPLTRWACSLVVTSSASSVSTITMSLTP